MDPDSFSASSETIIDQFQDDPPDYERMIHDLEKQLNRETVDLLQMCRILGHRIDELHMKAGASQVQEKQRSNFVKVTRKNGQSYIFNSDHFLYITEGDGDECEIRTTQLVSESAFNKQELLKQLGVE